jgi:glycerophosphoryl diester phosphodiesterase
MRRTAFALTLALTLGTAAYGTSVGWPTESAGAPGSRVMLDAHNAYPYNGRFVDRIDRALATGLPVAIEQDLVWLPATAAQPARSIVSHGAPFDGTEPTLRDHFFERIRPIVERALADKDTSRWPLITLNLDLKTNEPEHHQAMWALLGEYESWLTTAERTAEGQTPSALDVKPVLVLTGSSDAQEQAFHHTVSAGARLRLFGAVAQPFTGARATNYRRWLNAPWSMVEPEGQREAGDWTASDADRLKSLVTRAHAAGLWVRTWTLNGSDEATRQASGWSAGYNFGSPDAARLRWQAAIDAGVDFVATDQYELFATLLPRARR